MSDKARFQCLTPILSVKDVSASIAYYVETLGFTRRWDWPDEREHKTFGCVGRGEVELFFCQDGQGQPGMWVSIFVDDVDALYEEYQRSGAMIRQPPTNFPWGIREMNVQDPDGHRLRLGSESKGPADGVPLCED